jgi:hypothetical protein
MLFRSRVTLELPWSPRRRAALSLLAPAGLSFGILGIFWVTPDPAPRGLLVILDTEALIAIGFAAVLLSRRTLKRAGRYTLLGLVIAVSLLSLVAAPILLLGWMAPVWFVLQYVLNSPD